MPSLFIFCFAGFLLLGAMSLIVDATRRFVEQYITRAHRPEVRHLNL